MVDKSAVTPGVGAVSKLDCVRRGGSGINGGEVLDGNGGGVIDADGSEDGSAEGGAFFGAHTDAGNAVDVGLELSPEGAARGAAGEACEADADAEASEDFKLSCHTESDAFEDCADKFGAGVTGFEADPGGARVWVGVGAAFAGEVGEEREVGG